MREKGDETFKLRTWQDYGIKDSFVTPTVRDRRDKSQRVLAYFHR